jgi:hypothetical protein
MREVASRWSGDELNRATRTVTLRDERSGSDSRHLWAYLDDEDNLHIDGQDLGPGTAVVSNDGEYEWFQKISADDLTRLLDLLGAPSAADVLDILEQQWTGGKSYDLERLIRESDIKVERFVWGG